MPLALEKATRRRRRGLKSWSVSAYSHAGTGTSSLLCAGRVVGVDHVVTVQQPRLAGDPTDLGLAVEPGDGAVELQGAFGINHYARRQRERASCHEGSVNPNAVSTFSDDRTVLRGRAAACA